MTKLARTELELLKLQYTDLGGPVARLIEAYVYLQSTCDVCFTSSWSPCPEDTPGAIRDKADGWMVCGYCAAVRDVERLEADREVADSLIAKLYDDNEDLRNKEEAYTSTNRMIKSEVTRLQRHLIKLYLDEQLSEGQLATALGVDRLVARAMIDEYRNS